MKNFIVLALILCSATAQAETIELYSTPGFGYLHQYQGVANSTDADVSLVLPNGAITPDNGFLYLDGVQFTCPNMLKFPPQNVPSFSTCVNLDTGAVALLSITEVWYRKYISQGRAHYYVTKWTLVTGTITQ